MDNLGVAWPTRNIFREIEWIETFPFSCGKELITISLCLLFFYHFYVSVFERSVCSGVGFYELECDRCVPPPANMTLSSSESCSALEWKFSQVLGEPSPGEDIQDSK